MSADETNLTLIDTVEASIPDADSTRTLYYGAAGLTIKDRVDGSRAVGSTEPNLGRGHLFPKGTQTRATHALRSYAMHAQSS